MFSQTLALAAFTGFAVASTVQDKEEAHDPHYDQVRRHTCLEFVTSSICGSTRTNLGAIPDCLWNNRHRQDQ